jgi:type IV pilus assembly protein PilB
MVIGQSLRQAGAIGEAALQEALAEHARSGERLGSVLLRLNLATERQIAQALADQLGLACLDLRQEPPAPAAIGRLSKEVAIRYACVAIAVEKHAITVAMSDPLQLSVVQDLEFQTGCRVTQVVATREDILDAIHRGYPDNAATAVATPGAVADTPRPIERNRPGASDASPIAEMVDLLIDSALRNGASDVHVEPTDTGVVVRQRLDGLLREVMDLPKWVHEGVVSRIKIMAGIDIAEKRAPQDGRIHAKAADGQSIDLRVSTLRTVLGEKVVLRVLDQRKGVPPLESLGLSARALEQVRRLLRHSHGMILVVGPTGSGKTTTLSSALAALRSERTNIVTIEDPVEYQIAGVNQTQINSRINLTFASSLRAILRQDPDVILVGEIRDQETARIAVQAAQTGHLVLSTLHTDDAPSCVARLTDIGVEAYASSAALVGVIAQRLVRRLCTHCRCPYNPEPEMLRTMGVVEAEGTSVTFYRAVGCDQCHHTGYQGRVGIYEVLPVTDALRRLMAQEGAQALIAAAVSDSGMISLREDGVAKVRAGTTTPEELLRVVTELRPAAGVCSACGEFVAHDFRVCPACGQRVDSGCSHCGRLLRPTWNYCPYCAEPSGAATEHEDQVSRLRVVR